ncbi:TPA_asm: tail protein [Caudoviricetes sp. vir525]|nr:TPA_asm: tail protein [Caudoviricetes sp. vir525]
MGFLNRLPARQDGYYNRNRMWKNKGSDTAANRRTLVSPSHMLVNIGGAGAHAYELAAALDMDLNESWVWDTQTPTDYTVAANRAGKDFYIYVCIPGSGFSPILVLSAATTYPAGYSAADSRKIGGFHCECVDVGTISGHALTGYLAGDIIPRSCWDLSHRSAGAQAGMVWAGKTDFDTVVGPKIWVAIYLASGTGSSTASVNGGTISDTRDWMSFVDDFAAIGCRMLEDDEFQAIAAGSNEETNIAGSADPVTTGGHLDTASRRMISNIGCEDCCGVLWQWLRTQSYRFDGAANHTHQVVVSGDPETVTSSNPSGDVAPAFAYYDLPGAKGSLYKQGTYGDVKLLAGGCWWAGAAASGSRSRYAYSGYRWSSNSAIGGRACAESA